VKKTHKGETSKEGEEMKKEKVRNSGLQNRKRKARAGAKRKKPSNGATKYGREKKHGPANMADRDPGASP